MPFGLIPHVEYSKLAPNGVILCQIADGDPNPYAVGDVVLDSGNTANGVPVVGLPFFAALHPSTAFTPGPGLPSRLGTIDRPYGVIVAVPPDTPSGATASAGPLTVQPGQRTGPAFVSVLPVGNHIFDIVGDSAPPARGERVPNLSGTVQPGVSTDIVNLGELFAGLTGSADDTTA